MGFTSAIMVIGGPAGTYVTLTFVSKASGSKCCCSRGFVELGIDISCRAQVRRHAHEEEFRPDSERY
jgi:hypothetical protein